MRQLGWYVLQSAVVIGWMVFILEVVNKAPTTAIPTSPGVAFFSGLLLAALATGIVNALAALWTWCRKPKRLRGIRQQ